MAERKLPPYSKLAENALVRGREFNRIAADMVEASADAGLGVQPEQVSAFADADQPLAIITGKAQPTTSEPWSYSFIRAALQPDGTVKADYSLTGTAGTGNYYEARERGGNAFVPIDGSVVVKLKLSDSGAWFEFSYDPTDYWFEITGGAGPAYASKRKLHVTGTTWADLINPYTGTVYTGTPTQNPLREIHGVTGLVAGTIVRGYPGGSSGAPQVVIGRQQMGDSDTLHEIQTVYIKGAAAGTYVIDGDTLAYNHNAAALEAAIAGTTVTGSGTEGSPWLVEWTDFLPHDLLEADTGLLLGDQEWLFDCTWGGNVTFKNLTVTGTTTGVGGITSLNALTGATQTFAVGTSGSNFAIVSSGTVHTFNLPDASPTARGVVTTAAQTIAGLKTFNSDIKVLGGTIEIGPYAFGSFRPYIRYNAPGLMQIVTVNESNGDYCYVNFYAPGRESGFGDGSFYLTSVTSGGGTTPAFGIGSVRGGTAITGGLNFLGGLYISGTSSIAIGMPISGGTTGGILFPNAGILDDSPNLTFDQALPALTLGGGGYLVTSATGPPTGLAPGQWGGPYPS